MPVTSKEKEAASPLSFLERGAFKNLQKLAAAAKR
jgi:hypothetical protein